MKYFFTHHYLFLYLLSSISIDVITTKSLVFERNLHHNLFIIYTFKSFWPFLYFFIENINYYCLYFQLFIYPTIPTENTSPNPLINNSLISII